MLIMYERHIIVITHIDNMSSSAAGSWSGAAGGAAGSWQLERRGWRSWSSAAGSLSGAAGSWSGSS